MVGGIQGDRAAAISGNIVRPAPTRVAQLTWRANERAWLAMQPTAIADSTSHSTSTSAFTVITKIEQHKQQHLRFVPTDRIQILLN